MATIVSVIVLSVFVGYLVGFSHQTVRQNRISVLRREAENAKASALSSIDCARYLSKEYNKLSWLLGKED